MILEKEKTFIISLGGSLIVPNEIDWKFIKKFKLIIENKIKKGFHFIIITGGGKIARNYIVAAEKADSVNEEDKDWLGIHATRMNAQFIRTIFRSYAHPRVNTNPHDLEDFYFSDKPILVASGWRPGNSTDFIAVMIAKYLGIKKVINLSNINYLYDKDPNIYPKAKKIKKINWKDFFSIVGEKWMPGMHTPFDPIASKTAQEEGIEVAIIGGKNLKNLENYLNGNDFEGTVIN